MCLDLKLLFLAESTYIRRLKTNLKPKIGLEHDFTSPQVDLEVTLNWFKIIDQVETGFF